MVAVEQPYRAVPIERWPRWMLFQWHITERCNLRCIHCYQENVQSPELEFKEWLTILSQLEDFLDRCAGHRQEPVRAQITLTGGEPFVRPDFLDLVEIIAKKNGRFRVAVLTNGTLIERALARRLKKAQPRFVQVSLEGTEATHDAIRGSGSYREAVNGIRLLRQEQIAVSISFTAHRQNFREFGQVAETAREVGANYIWADRLIPAGNACESGCAALTPAETREFFESMEAARKQSRNFWFRRTRVGMDRALQFLFSGERPYHCTAGETLLTIMPNGDLYPCRRLPIRVGNLFESSIAELYQSSELLTKLRRPTAPAACDPCAFRHCCRGGLKCLSYAMTGSPFAADPGCWLANCTLSAKASQPTR